MVSSIPPLCPICLSRTPRLSFRRSASHTPLLSTAEHDPLFALPDHRDHLRAATEGAPGVTECRFALAAGRPLPVQAGAVLAWAGCASTRAALTALCVPLLRSLAIRSGISKR